MRELSDIARHTPGVQDAIEFPDFRSMDSRTARIPELCSGLEAI